MNEVIQMAEWQFILYFIFVALNGAFLGMFIMPKIEKWLIKFNKDLEKFNKGDK